MGWNYKVPYGGCQVAWRLSQLRRVKLRDQQSCVIRKNMYDAHVNPGLRERKKLATRQALGYAAMRLAVERGLDNLLVEDIAAAANVSPRTFNNYFSSKYEAICALAVDRARRAGDALRRRPRSEPFWEAVIAAVLAEYAGMD